MGKPTKSGTSRLFEFTGKHKPLVVISCILSAISAVGQLSPFVCIYFVVQEILAAAPDIRSVDVSRLAMYGWLAVGLSAGAFLLYFAALMCSHIAAFHTARNMKSQLLHHLVKLPLGYHTANSSGKLRKIVDENSGQTETFIAHQIPDLAGSYVTPAAVIVMLLVFDWRLGVLSLLSLVIGLAIEMRMMAKSSSTFLKNYQNSLEDMNNEAVEYVRGISVVKVFGQTVHSFKRFYQSIMQYKEFVIKYTLSWQMPMTAFVTAIHGTFFLLIPAGILIAANTADYTHFLLSFIFYVIFTPACATMLMKVMFSGNYKMIADEAVRRVESILVEKPLPDSAVKTLPRGCDIEFSDVAFTYPNAEIAAVSEVSLRVPEGTTAALVGPSGGGKTTIASLIPRFWDVDSGSVKLGGADVREIPPEVLMQQVAFVFQDTRLFKASVLDNIRFNRPDATREEALAAAKAAQCEDILAKLPKGIDTVIGTKGVYLSGGEQQRIALARAVLKDSPVIILDEATAFADPENEYKIQLAFERLTRGKTVLMIAHRLSTVQNANQLFVVDGGKVVETGTHDTLVQHNGLYARMWEDYQTSAAWGIGKEAIHVS
jgi:ATP-binding cassette subfamily B protein IrtA